MNLLSLDPLFFATDIDGTALNLGYVYIGVAGVDPQLNPQTVYWDAAGAFPIAQPLRTVNGRVYNAGSPAQVYINADYSCRVLNANGTQVAYIRTAKAMLDPTAGLLLNGGGLVVSGATGGLAIARGDAGIEIQSLGTLAAGTNRHAMLSLYNVEKTEENSVGSWHKLSDGTLAQTVGFFARLQNSNDNPATWHSVAGWHNVGSAGEDNTVILGYSTNALWLIPGNTALLPWNTLPGEASVVQIGNIGGGVKIRPGVVAGYTGFSGMGVGAMTSANAAMLIKDDGTVTQFNAVAGGQVNTAINNVVIASITNPGAVSPRFTVTGLIQATGTFNMVTGTADTAGGALAMVMGSAQLGVYWGTGAPAISAPKGSFYLRRDGNAVNNRAYIATDAVGGWTNFTTAT